MIGTIARGITIAVALAAVTGSVATGTAQAQVWGGTPNAVRQAASQVTALPNAQPKTCEGAKPNTPLRPLWAAITADGVNIRQAPWGTVLAIANHTDSVSNPIDETVDPAGNAWFELIDYTQRNTLGWVFGQYVSYGNDASARHNWYC